MRLRHLRLVVGWVVGLGVVTTLTWAAVHALFDADVVARYRRPDPLGFVLVLVATGTLVICRRRPALALLLTSAATLALAWFGYSRWIAAVGPALAAGVLIGTSSTPVAVGASMTAFTVVAFALHGDPYVSRWLAETALSTGGAIALGATIRLWRLRPEWRLRQPAAVARGLALAVWIESRGVV